MFVKCSTVSLFRLPVVPSIWPMDACHALVLFRRPPAQPLFHASVALSASSAFEGCSAWRCFRSAFSARSHRSTSASSRPSCSSGYFAAGANSCEKQWILSTQKQLQLALVGSSGGGAHTRSSPLAMYMRCVGQDSSPSNMCLKTQSKNNKSEASLNVSAQHAKM